MSKRSRSDRQLVDQAQEYLTDLPDETAAGRMVDDEDNTADPVAWELDEAQQRARLNTGRVGRDEVDPTTPIRAKKGNQPT